MMSGGLGETETTLKVLDVWRQMQKHAPDEMTRELVNIGAADRYCLPRHHCDPVNHILQHIGDSGDGSHQESGLPQPRFRGILVDPGWQSDANDHKFWSKSDAMAEGRVQLLRQNVSVDSIGELLRDTGVHKSFDVLKIDTDGNDCDMIAQIFYMDTIRKSSTWKSRRTFPLLSRLTGIRDGRKARRCTRPELPTLSCAVCHMQRTCWKDSDIPFYNSRSMTQRMFCLNIGNCSLVSLRQTLRGIPWPCPTAPTRLPTPCALIRCSSAWHHALNTCRI